MMFRNAAPQAPATMAILAAVATPDHVWRARLAREQAEKMEALDQAQVAELMCAVLCAAVACYSGSEQMFVSELIAILGLGFIISD